MCSKRIHKGASAKSCTSTDQLWKTVRSLNMKRFVTFSVSMAVGASIFVSEYNNNKKKKKNSNVGYKVEYILKCIKKLLNKQHLFSSHALLCCTSSHLCVFFFFTSEHFALIKASGGTNKRETNITSKINNNDTNYYT